MPAGPDAAILRLSGRTVSKAEQLGAMRMQLGFWRAGLVAASLLAASSALAAASSHYASLRSDKVFLREGPTYQHRILWIYRRKGYPVEIVASYADWRRVRDSDGTVGWINEALLSDARTVLVTGTKRVPIRAGAGADAKVIALAEPGVVARLKACKPSACQVASGGIEGWIDKNDIWGVDAGDVFE